MYVVSDTVNGARRISGLFCGKNAKQAAKRWAGSRGKVTQLRKVEFFLALQAGQELPKRYK